MRSRATRGLPTPELEDEPLLGDAGRWHYQAFMTLSTTRQIGMGGVGPIPWTAINDFARRYELTPREFERFSEVIDRVDRFWRTETAPKPDPRPRRKG